MKSMRPPQAVIFFMTYFYRVGGRHDLLGPPLDLLLFNIVETEKCIGILMKLNLLHFPKSTHGVKYIAEHINYESFEKN